METLILLVFFGIFSAVFATQNIGTASITLMGFSLRDVPMYLIVLGSLLIGLLLSSIVSIATSILTFFKLHSKDVKIKETNKAASDLAKRNRELELEVSNLKEQRKLSN